MRRAGFKRFTGTSAILSAALLVSCMANPGPAPTVDEQEELIDAPSDDEPAEGDSDASDPGEGQDTDSGADEGVTDDDAGERSSISVGIDAFQLGFNPHLVADDTELVDALADLVFPSPFSNDAIDTDVLNSAREIEAPAGVAQRLRYSIKEGAQWSDGTPITGADFDYLWKEMVSTPGVRELAPYRAISAISISAGGSIVTVDLSTPVADWHRLFTHLLPSHLLESGQFDRVLDADIPASAGKFSVANIDQARGLITLNRNDRFWGKNPATIDVVQLRAIRSTPQAANLLRSEQVSFVDISPTQTLKEQLSLLGDISAESVHPSRQLRLNLSTQSRVLETPQLRRTMLSVIDTQQLARLATERAVDLRVPYGGNPLLGSASESEIAALAEATKESPLRIGVDPTDKAAAVAAMTLVDMLRLEGVDARVAENRMTTIVEESLSEGDVDAVISTVDTSVTAANVASFFTCHTDEETTPAASELATEDLAQTTTAKPDADKQNQQKVWSGNLSLACAGDYNERAQKILSGEISAQQGLEMIRQVNREQSFYLPLIDETRIRAHGADYPGGSLATLDEIKSNF